MNFSTIDEMEFYELGSVRGQLRLMSNLLASPGVHASSLHPADVHEFIDAQMIRLSTVIDTLKDRADALTKHHTAKMSAMDWLMLVHTLSGHGGLTPGSEFASRLAAKMQLAAQADSDMQEVADAFSAVVAAHRAPPPVARRAGAKSRPQATPSKREKLLAKA